MRIFSIKIFSIVCVVGLLLTPVGARAEATRSLTCTNTAGSIVIGICGINGCAATVTVGSTATTYSTKRTKANDGALTYKTKTGASRKCTIVIGPLSRGARKVQNASCAKALKGANCQIG